MAQQPSHTPLPWKDVSVVVAAGPIFRACALGIGVLCLSWLSWRDLEGYRIPVTDLSPLGSLATLWRGRQEAGDGEEQARGDMTAIKAPGILCSLPTVLLSLDPRTKLLGKQDQLRQCFALASRSLNPPEVQTEINFFFPWDSWNTAFLIILPIILGESSKSGRFPQGFWVSEAESCYHPVSLVTWQDWSSPVPSGEFSASQWMLTDIILTIIITHTNPQITDFIT